MAKVNRPRGNTTGKARALAAPAATQQQCWACASRKSASAFMKSFVEKGDAPPDFTGFMYYPTPSPEAGGDMLSIFEFHNGRQVGFIVVDGQSIEQFLEDTRGKWERFQALQREIAEEEAVRLSREQVVKTSDIDEEAA